MTNKAARVLLTIFFLCVIAAAIVWGMRESYDKDLVKQAARKVAQAEYKKSLWKKRYTLTPGKIIPIPIIGRQKIQMQTEDPYGTFMFRCLDPHTGLPMLIPKSEAGGWRKVYPGEMVTEWDLPNPGEAGTYEFRWWVPRGTHPSVRKMVILVGFKP